MALTPMSWPDPVAGDATRVLVVCTANICRSPAAAQLLRDRASARGVGVSVSSAGFLEDGRSGDPTMVALAATRGIVVGDHRSTVVDEPLLRSADLVVTMERRHARELVVMAPDHAHRVHTLLGLLEAAVRAAPSGEIDSWLRTVTADRHAADLMGDRGADQIPDPYGRAKRHYRTCLDSLEQGVDGLVGTLAALS